jgi:hypothetical protein
MNRFWCAILVLLIAVGIAPCLWAQGQPPATSTSMLATASSAADKETEKSEVAGKILPMAEQLQRGSKPRPFKTGSWVKFLPQH